MRRVGVIGAGSWGAALALLCARNGLEVALWARREAAAKAIRENGESPRLPGVTLDGVAATAAPESLNRADFLLAVVPAQATRATLARLAPYLRPGAPLLLCSKGIERGSLMVMSAVAETVAPGRPIGVLSGPSFAADVASGLPTAVTLAIKDRDIGLDLQAALAAPAFRPYLSDDPLGAQIGGAIKNVLAIACGAAEGMGLGASARAALIARGFVEMLRLARAMGAREQTLRGLSGLGDLTLTCNSTQSRNFSFGLALARRGEETMSAETAPVYEGAQTAEAAAALMLRYGVEAPITFAVASAIKGDLTLEDAVRSLLDRPPGEDG